MLFKKYLSIGGPVLISDVILTLGLNMIAIIMGRIGSDLVAANRISNVVLQFTNVFLMGIASASGVIVGNTIGTGKTEEAYHRGVTFFLISIILGIVSAVIIFTMKYFILDVYNISAETKAIAHQLMNATTLLVVFMSVNEGGSYVEEEIRNS